MLNNEGLCMFGLKCIFNFFGYNKYQLMFFFDYEENPNSQSNPKPRPTSPSPKVNVNAGMEFVYEKTKK